MHSSIRNRNDNKQTNFHAPTTHALSIKFQLIFIRNGYLVKTSATMFYISSFCLQDGKRKEKKRSPIEKPTQNEKNQKKKNVEIVKQLKNVGFMRFR